MMLKRLPCGGSITTGDGDEGDLLRVKRNLGEGGREVLFILGRPSPEPEPDPERDLCIAFAKKRGFDTCTILYLFPFRVQNVRELQAIPFPQGGGPANRRLIRHEIRQHHYRRATIVAAWGDDGLYQDAGPDLIECFDGTPYGGAPSETIPFMAFGRTRRRAPAPPTARDIGKPLIAPFGPAAERSAA